MTFLLTVSPTVPFWDPGEFLAVANTLGIPHPPGTPFFVTIGRLAALVPIGSVAQRVNGLVALAAAIAVLLTYLCTLRILRRLLGHGAPGASQSSAPDAGTEVLAQFGAVIAALMLAFSDNFWKKAVDGEVFSVMSLGQILTLWAGLKWWEVHERRPSAGLLLVGVYIMWVSVGLHLGVGMMGLPLMVLVWMVDRPTALAFSMPFVSVLGVTYGMEFMSGIITALSILVFGVYAYRGRLSWTVWWISVIVSAFFLQQAFTDTPFTPLTATLAVFAVGLPLFVLARRTQAGRIMAVALALMIVGFSTHVYLPIRAAQHPAINEGDPSSWARLRDLLERKQYGTNSPGGLLHRRAPLGTQLDKEFWRYWKRQWPLAPRALPRTPGVVLPEPRWWSYLLPSLIGLFGLWQLRRDRVSWLTLGSLFALASVGMILFLNFTDHEVRDRDYFFTTAFHLFAIFIGIGAAALVAWVRESFEGGQRRLAGIGTAALLGLQPLLLAHNLWFIHDRHRNYVAHDYAYNMLAPLAKDSFIFTNGDNDTFPLWYMQEVEHFRTDVRVVNLSLLNTDWYIEQLRDDPPRLPVRLNDAEIRSLGAGYVADSTGRPLYYTNEFMVRHLIESSRQPGGRWIRQPYFAVTVPEQMGYTPYLSLEGLDYRVNPDSTSNPRVDVQTTRRNMYDVFRYRGLFSQEGTWDTTVYKDENAATLSRNYAAAHIQLAFDDRRHGDLPGAIREMERVERMFPDWVEAQLPLGGFYLDHGDTARSVEFFERLTRIAPQNPEVLYYAGVSQVFGGHFEAGMHDFDAAIGLDGSYGQAYYGAYYAARQHGDRERAVGYLQRWVDAHPEDSQAAQLLQMERGTGPSRAGQTPPPPPRVYLP